MIMWTWGTRHSDEYGDKYSTELDVCMTEVGTQIRLVCKLDDSQIVKGGRLEANNQYFNK